MSIKKPIIKVTRECPYCYGTGKKYEYMNIGLSLKDRDISNECNCSKCKGSGRIDIKRNNKDFKKYYIKNLEEVIEYFTKLYRNKNDEAQEYLKKVRKYCKELDKVVNK